MPEGHSVHRIAGQFTRDFVGHEIAVSSPQGRFASGAARLDGREMVSAHAVGKQMFLEFAGGLWLRVHLGIYGAWDFSGELTPAEGMLIAAASLGAPRRARLRAGESETLSEAPDVFPPEPVGAVRVRLLAPEAVADLRGPTACEVQDSAEVQRTIDKLGPDPINDDDAAGRDRFIASVRSKRTPIARLLMDQSIVSGIGNVFRAEMLFRARLNPHTPGTGVTSEQASALWEDWAHLLRVGVETGLMLTRDEPVAEQAAMAKADRYWVYKREGLPCRVCGTNIAMEMMASRKLYWCPACQA
jgi:endonuclease-8